MAALVTLYLISLCLIPIVITKKKRPVTTLAWMLAIVFLPVVGGFLYLIFGPDRISNPGRRKLFSNKKLRKHLGDLEAEWNPRRLNGASERLSRRLRDIEQVSQKLGFFGAVGNNSVEILVDAEDTYERIEEAILSAKHSINLEYYIFEPDLVGKRLQDALVKKANEGVEIRLLYDAIGSISLGWKKSFLKVFSDAGISVHDFLALRTFFKPWNINLRNHRKILIVDSKIGFTGSLNIGRQFLNDSQPGDKCWRETHVLIKGPAVTQLQWIFGEDWFFATGEEVLSPRYLSPHKSPGSEVVQIVASGPDEREEAIHKSFLAAINQSERSVFLTTPYFIPERSLNLALQLAALRGVDVRILLPRTSDHKFVSMAGRSYYADLLKNGVKIFEYQRGVLHAKMLVVDGHFVSIGSANSDIRSFSYNFEVNVQIYGRAFARKAERIFLKDLESCKEIDLKKFLQRPAIKIFLENCCRLFSPVL